MGAADLHPHPDLIPRLAEKRASNLMAGNRVSEPGQESVDSRHSRV
jgi:hypothetical protein